MPILTPPPNHPSVRACGLKPRAQGFGGICFPHAKTFARACLSCNGGCLESATRVTRVEGPCVSAVLPALHLDPIALTAIRHQSAMGGGAGSRRSRKGTRGGTLRGNTCGLVPCFSTGGVTSCPWDRAVLAHGSDCEGVLWTLRGEAPPLSTHPYSSGSALRVRPETGSLGDGEVATRMCCGLPASPPQPPGANAPGASGEGGVPPVTYGSGGEPILLCT